MGGATQPPTQHPTNIRDALYDAYHHDATSILSVQGDLKATQPHYHPLGDLEGDPGLEGDLETQGEEVSLSDPDSEDADGIGSSAVRSSVYVHGVDALGHDAHAAPSASMSTAATHTHVSSLDTTAAVTSRGVGVGVGVDVDEAQHTQQPAGKAKRGGKKQAVPLCVVCQEAASRWWSTCPSCGCRAHVECLARQFTGVGNEREGGGGGTCVKICNSVLVCAYIMNTHATHAHTCTPSCTHTTTLIHTQQTAEVVSMPQGGPCPSCEAPRKWMEVLETLSNAGWTGGRRTTRRRNKRCVYVFLVCVWMCVYFHGLNIQSLCCYPVV